MLEPVIIDDEIQILRGLEKLIDWHAIGYEQPKCFSSPYSALDYIRKSSCRVVITDIRMPELSGLELIQRIRAIRQEMQIVVISSYSNFEYIQKALIAGVRNYILKPIHEDELLETLMRIQQELSTAENTHDGTQTLQKQVLTRLIHGQAYLLTPVEKAWYRRCIDTCTYQLMLMGANRQKSEDLLHTLLQPPATPAQSCIISMEDCTLVVLLRTVKPQGARVISTAGILRSGAPPVLYTGQHAHFDLLYERVCMLRHKLTALRFMTPEVGGLIAFHAERMADLGAQQHTLDATIHTYFDRLKDALFSLTQDQLEKEFDQLNSVLQKACDILSPDTVISAYHKLQDDLIASLEKRLCLAAGKLHTDSHGSEEKLPTLKALTATILAHLQLAIRQAQCLITTGEHGTVATVALYIQLNYQKPLTLNSVASHFFFNPSYLSFLFSKNGLSFLSYVNDVRLKRGAALLLETDLTISTIARATGFYSDKNFYKSFRKKYGCTPTQYRTAK